MLTRRSEALRRLGGPVCPICDAVGAEVEVRFLTTDGSTWLKERGKGIVEKQSLAPMCAPCFSRMQNDITGKLSLRAAEALRRVDALIQRDARDLAHLSGMDGPKYREACADHEDDLAAAERMAADWGVGNGLFGSRSE
jgi:hypothetical protein